MIYGAVNIDSVLNPFQTEDFLLRKDGTDPFLSFPLAKHKYKLWKQHRKQSKKSFGWQQVNPTVYWDPSITILEEAGNQDSASLSLGREGCIVQMNSSSRTAASSDSKRRYKQPDCLWAPSAAGGQRNLLPTDLRRCLSSSQIHQDRQVLSAYGMQPFVFDFEKIRWV